PVPSKSFSGKGQLRTRWNEGDYADLGCLTDHGRWTSDESLCGTFTANQYTTGTYAQVAFTLTSASGPCNMLGGRLDCEPGNEPYKYFGIWQFRNSIPGVDCFRYAQYGLMATWGKSPPTPEDPPQDLHLTSYAEPGKRVWLTWKPLE
ncbi:hypothetical protein N656DRAFT_691281, partial [Canariomyces notabilis]